MASTQTIVTVGKFQPENAMIMASLKRVRINKQLKEELCLFEHTVKGETFTGLNFRGIHSIWVFTVILSRYS